MPALITIHPAAFEARLARRVLDAYTWLDDPTDRERMLTTLRVMFGDVRTLRLLEMAERDGLPDGAA